MFYDFQKIHFVSPLLSVYKYHGHYLPICGYGLLCAVRSLNVCTVYDGQGSFERSHTKSAFSRYTVKTNNLIKLTRNTYENRVVILNYNYFYFYLNIQIVIIRYDVCPKVDRTF